MAKTNVRVKSLKSAKAGVPFVLRFPSRRAYAFVKRAARIQKVSINAWLSTLAVQVALEIVARDAKPAAAGEPAEG